MSSFGALADEGLAHEGRSFFDGKGASGDVAHHDSVALQLAALGDSDVAFDLAENGHSARLHFALDVSILTNCEAAIGLDFAIDFAVDDQVVRELDGAFDFNIIGEDVFRG